MKKYEDINSNIKNWLDEIVVEDKYGLDPKTLYYNIYNSLGEDKTLAEIFAVPIGLIKAVKGTGSYACSF